MDSSECSNSLAIKKEKKRKEKKHLMIYCYSAINYTHTRARGKSRANNIININSPNLSRAAKLIDAYTGWSARD